MVKKNNFLGSLNLFKNKSAKKSYNGILIIAGILGVLFLMGFVMSWASETLPQEIGIIKVYNATGSLNTIDINPNLTLASEGTQFYLFINVSNPETAQSNLGAAQTNITNVSIAFDEGVVITGYNLSKGDIGGLGGNDSFNNGSSAFLGGNAYNWNSSNLVNTTGNATFEFNGIIDVPGTYNITVRLGNGSVTGGVMVNNVTFFYINDSTAPYNVTAYSNTTGFSSISPSYRSYPTTRANISDFSIYLSLNARDFYEIGAGGLSYIGQNISGVNVTLYNSTGLVNSTLIVNGMGDINESFAVNFSFHPGTVINLSDDHYYINVTTVNDSKGNINYTGLNFNITLDRTAPSVTATKSGSSTGHQIVLDLTVSDVTSGIAGKQCSATGGGTDGIVMSGNTGTQTLTQANLGCNSAYTYSITCTDHSGNSKGISTTVNTDTCTGGTSNSGGTGGSSGSDVVGSATSPYWTLTYNEATTDLNGDSDGVSVNLAEQYRVKIKVDTKLYYVGVTGTTDTTANINVTTTTKDKEATMNIGDVKKFDVNADDKYDVAVTLNGIDSATGKADLSLVYVQEPVSAEDQEQVSEEVGEVPTTTATKSKTWIWVILVLVVLAIVGAILFGKKQTRHKNYGF